MKDELVAAVLFIALIGLFVYNSHALTEKTERITALIDAADKAGSVTRREVEEIRSSWEREKKLLLYITAHGNILSIDECMEMAWEYLDEDRYDLALHSLKKSRHHLEDLREREKIRLDNIF